MPAGALALTLLLVAGCRDRGTATPATSNGSPAAVAETGALTPEELGVLGAQIEKSPADAKRLLAARGLSEESFEAAIRKVSEDPAAAKRYAAAFRRASHDQV